MFFASNYFSFLLSDPKNDPLKKLKELILELFGSGYVLILRVGTIVAVFAFIYTGFLAFKQYKKEKEQVKTNIYGVLLGMCIFFGASSIVGIAINIVLSFTITK